MCRLPLPEGWKSCCYRSGGRSSAFTGIIASSCINMCRLSFSTHWHCFHESVFLQVANNSGYIQVDWKRVEKDVNKAKKQLKKGTDQAVPELNTFVEKVILLWVVWLTVRSFSPSHYNEKVTVSYEIWFVSFSPESLWRKTLSSQVASSEDSCSAWHLRTYRMRRVIGVFLCYVSDVIKSYRG